MRVLANGETIRTRLLEVTDPSGEEASLRDSGMQPDVTVTDANDNIHYHWDNDLDPVQTVDSGSVVIFECRDATDGQLDRGSTAADVLAMDVEGHALTGPVAVAGADPGDVLTVDLPDFEHHGYGVSYVYPGQSGAGLLPDEFPDAYCYGWDLDDGVAQFEAGIEVPMAPFPGNLGVAPEESGAHSTVPPRNVGGNLDVKHLTAGSTLYLPVEVTGALFSIGDCHAAQGDGEVCITGIEAPMDATVRLRLVEGDLDAPTFETTGPFTPTGQDERMYVTTGISDGLMEACRVAISRMLDHLETERGLTREQAYVLASVAVDLKVNQVVDAPNWTVSAYLAESLFPYD